MSLCSTTSPGRLQQTNHICTHRTTPTRPPETQDLPSSTTIPSISIWPPKERVKGREVFWLNRVFCNADGYSIQIKNMSAIALCPRCQRDGATITVAVRNCYCRLRRVPGKIAAVPVRWRTKRRGGSNTAATHDLATKNTCIASFECYVGDAASLALSGMLYTCKQALRLL